MRVEVTWVVATLARTLGSLDLAEDAVQEAAVAALRTWPQTGIPDDPRAWLAVTARHKAYDVLRREAVRPGKESAASQQMPGNTVDPADEVTRKTEPDSVVRDDMLRLVFTCCHPALSLDARVALALRTLARLEVPAIARAFLVPEPTMAKRLVRARGKIAAARIPYRVPSDAELPERLPAVLAVVHLIATEAHAPTGGEDVARADLEAEAVRLARLLAELMPGEPGVLSLLALLLFTAARRPARTDAGGDPVLLADQDRFLWDRAAICEASALLAEAVRRSGGVAGPYQLQAHLSECHSTSPAWPDTDWDRIIGLYDLMLRISPNPAVALNRAVAVGERDGPAVMLEELDAIAAAPRSHLWHAARADALRRLGRPGPARQELALALAEAPTGPERRLLARRLAALSPDPGPGYAAGMVDTSVAHVARVYNYWLGGTDNFAADREAAERAIEAYPDIVHSVRANRAFLGRTARYLVREGGVRQFLDIGTGIPTANNTHEVAQAEAAECRVVYVDNDPVVLAHARALLSSTPAGVTAYVDADLRDTGTILAEAANVLDFSRPVAVMLMAILQHVDNAEDPYGIVGRLVAAVPSGSYLALSHPASDIEAEAMAEMGKRLNQLMAEKVTFRGKAEVTRFFDGLDLVDPGMVRVQQWRPDTEAERTSPAALWGGVARKP